MSWFSRRAALAGLASAALAGCGFRPLYGGGDGLTGDVAFEPPADRFGYYVRESLRRRLGEPRADASHRLEIETKTRREEVAISSDSSITRVRYRALTTFRLIERDTGAVALQDTVEAISSFDTTASQFATRTSERSVEERTATTIGEKIATRVAAFQLASAEAADPAAAR